VEESLDTLIPDNPNQPYDMKELITKVADEGDFYEIQEEFAGNIITGFIRLEGQTVGVVANQPMVWRVFWTSTARARRRGSCGSATVSRSRS
jgi:propionyl-CoA carboxylase beta chain